MAKSKTDKAATTERNPLEIIGKPLAYVLPFNRVEGDAMNEETRMIDVVFSTDTPIKHWFGSLILDHKKESIRMDRLLSNGPFLCNHNWDEKLGKIRTASTDGKQCTATIQIGRDIEECDNFWKYYQQDLCTGVSVGFVVHKLVMEEETDTETIYRATDWEPIEISDAYIPADTGCNVRELSFDDFKRATEKIERSEPSSNNTDAPIVRDEVKTIIEVKTMPEEKKEERTINTTSEVERAKELIEFGRLMYGEKGEEIARDVALAGGTRSDLRAKILESRAKSQEEIPTPKPLVNLTDKERRRYSISRAILADANIRDGQREDCFELEISVEAKRQLAKRVSGYEDKGGIVIPTGMALRGAREAMLAQSMRLDSQLALMRGMQTERAVLEMLTRAGLDTATDTAGQELLFTEQGSFIDLLRNRAMVMMLGATVLSGLQGNVALPKQIGAGTFSWVAQNPGSDVSESNLTLDQVTLSPKTGQSTTSYSRQLLTQSTVNVDGLVQSDLTRITALAIDRAAIHGSGSSNQPTGIYTASGVNSVAFGGVISLANVVNMETEIATDNADIGTMAYLTTPGARGKAKQTQEFSSSNGKALWVDGEMNGYRAEASAQVSSVMNASAATGGSSHGIILGVWEHMFIGEWGGLEIITDPYRLKKQGMIEVTSFVMVDIALRYAECFCKGTGQTLS